MDVSVGTRLRVLRKDVGLTQAQLAALADTNQAAINRYELTGRQRLTVSWSGMPTYFNVVLGLYLRSVRGPPRAVCLRYARGSVRKWCSANRIGVSLWRLASRRVSELNRRLKQMDSQYGRRGEAQVRRCTP